MVTFLNCLRNSNYLHKISSRNNKLQKFHIKIYLDSFVSIYNLYHLFGIIYKSIFYKLNITLMKNWYISKTINIRGDFIWKHPLLVWFFIFLSNRNIWNHFLYFHFLCYIFTFYLCTSHFFHSSNSLVPFIFSLCILMNNIIKGKWWSDK